MTKRELMQQYLNWAKAAEICDPPDISSGMVTLRIEDVFETDDWLIGQICYAVPVRTDRLRVFIYSERTVWKKDWLGDTKTILDESYQVI